MSFIFLIYSSCCHFVWQSGNICRNIGRGHYEEHFCEIILNLDQWLRRCHLKIFLFLDMVAILMDRVKQFVQFW